MILSFTFPSFFFFSLPSSSFFLSNIIFTLIVFLIFLSFLLISISYLRSSICPCVIIPTFKASSIIRIYRNFDFYQNWILHFTIKNDILLYAKHRGKYSPYRSCYLYKRNTYKKLFTYAIYSLRDNALRGSNPTNQSRSSLNQSCGCTSYCYSSI